jgi:phosphatidylglycerol---prolipoprotein diacylglyceryl transferase
MWTHNLNPTIFNLGPLEIRWYGLVYVLGFLLAIFWLRYLSKKGKLKLNYDQIWDFTFYLMVGVLVGARLFMFIWEPTHFFSHPLDIFKIWQGGMSFHGGFVGIVLAGWIYCKKKQINFWQMADFLSVPAIFALALGRIANFANSELIGKPFNGNWCVKYSNDDTCRHPNMIYAAAKRLMIFGWLLWLSAKDKFKPGFVFWNFVFFEGIGRIIVDFFRVDKLYYYLSLGQWMSLIMVLIAGGVFYKYYLQDWKKLLK